MVYTRQDGRPSVVPAALQPRVSASMGLVHVSAAAMRRLVPFLLTEREGIKQCPRVMIDGGGEAAAAGVTFCSTPGSRSRLVARRFCPVSTQLSDPTMRIACARRTV